MDDRSAGQGAEAIEELRRSLAAIAAQLGAVSSQVERLAAGAAAPASDSNGAPVPATEPAPAPLAPPSPVAAAIPVATPASAASPAVEPDSWLAAMEARSWKGARPPRAAQSGSPESAPQPVGSRVPAQTPAGAGSRPGSWADSAGFKTLGWVGGGVTVLGIVLLFVVAIQQDILGPGGRVTAGVLVGLILLAAGALVRRAERTTTLAVTLVCTGLAALYLTTVGAVGLAALAPPSVGHVASAAIAALAVAIAVRWHAPWLAGVAFAASALLAAVIGGSVVDVYLFEAVVLVGGAASLLIGLGLLAWTLAAGAAGLVMLICVTTIGVGPVDGAVVGAAVAVTWALLVGRWWMGAAPIDPGPFQIRPRSVDPEQIARDYADFHAHQARTRAAHSDAAVAASSLALSGGMLILVLALVTGRTVPDRVPGIIAAVCAVLFAALAVVAARTPALNRSALRLIAWCVAVGCAGAAVLRLTHGDVRSISWMVLAIVVLVAVGVEKVISLLIPALAAAVIAILAASPAIGPGDLLIWPSPGLIGSHGLLLRAWTVVVPGGVAVIAVAAAAWWAVLRCSDAALAAMLAQRAEAATADAADGLPVADPARAGRARATVLAWALLGCSAVACYGVLMLTMVLALAISPTRYGYQAGHIIVTAAVAVIALALLWQGFRRVVLRVGGLGLAAVAVTKLLLFDTSTLDALPRAITVIGVGILLLGAAAAYLGTLRRLDGADAPVVHDAR